jgi:CRISPR-associated endonuclease/helicase Cas3
MGENFMTSNDFREFYWGIHKKPTFPWQERLAKQVADNGRWPDLVSLPTASGKTSVLDIAVFALALQSQNSRSSRTARLRTFFVIDRRLVVDDVARHARNIRNALVAPEPNSLLEQVKTALCSYGVKSPLEVGVMRGGMYRSDMWADEPNQPGICVTTVDQLGSRVLFRGYGLRNGRLPVHAGLTGMDSLFILDEAHLSQPFVDTMQSVCMFQTEKWQSTQCGLPIEMVQMSATLSDQEEKFTLGNSDFEDPILKKRLEAKKLTTLIETPDLISEATNQALKLAAAPKTNVIAVVANTVNAARKIFQELRKGTGDAVLLTGRIRPFDRERLLERFLCRMKAGRDRKDDKPLFIVATQTIEVGADLDFDALVTEVAPLDALQQRFGRLDRLGELGQTQAVVLKPKRGKSSNWIYGEPLENTWAWLNQHAVTDNGSPRIDFGSRKMSSMVEQHSEDDLNCACTAGPMLLPAHLDSWVQTNPKPEPDPDVSPFLHGPDSLDSVEVQIVWRADLDKNRREEWRGIVADAPPLSTEALPLPLEVARKWLFREKAEVTDSEGIHFNDEEKEKQKKSIQSSEYSQRLFMIWRGPRIDEEDDRIRPGDTIVVRSCEGGTDEFGWHPESEEPVMDVGDFCADERAQQGLGRYRVRVHPNVLFQKPENSSEREELQNLLKAVKDEEASADSIGELLSTDDSRRIHGHVEKAITFDTAGLRQYKADGGWLWISSLICTKNTDTPLPHAEILSEPDESDEGDEGSMTRPKKLTEHTKGVIEYTRQYAEGCGLDAALVEDLVLAARLHDLGKCDERFQQMLDPSWITGDDFLAKGKGRRVSSEYQDKLERSHYPSHARHEFGSVALVTRSKVLQKANDQELVLHLIGTHHGHGRSLAPYWHDETDGKISAPADGEQLSDGEELSGEQPYRFARIDSGWTRQFWTLVGRYGYWGLAYLETILRRADCIQSRKEESEE